MKSPPVSVHQKTRTHPKCRCELSRNCSSPGPPLRHLLSAAEAASRAGEQALRQCEPLRAAVAQATVNTGVSQGASPSACRSRPLSRWSRPRRCPQLWSSCTRPVRPWGSRASMVWACRSRRGTLSMSRRCSCRCSTRWGVQGWPLESCRVVDIERQDVPICTRSVQPRQMSLTCVAVLSVCFG